jgi:putative ATP-dependent endonuclease of the OLD family
MFLSELNVENFRGIRRGHLTFGETTVIIGENDCGKSSLLDALARVLDATDAEPPQFEPQHFYRATGPDGDALAGPIRIELLFRERHAGEWDTPELAALGPLPRAQPPGPRQLSLRVTAMAPADDGPARSDWEFAVPGAKGAPRRNDAALLAAVRAFNPLILLRGGLISVAAPAPCPPPTPHGNQAPEVAALAREVEAHYQALIAGASPQFERELEEKFAAARTLLEQRAVDFRSRGSLSRLALAEVLGRPAEAIERRRQRLQSSAAERLGVLIFTAAVLRHLPVGHYHHARPIVVIEDPEAHLHLMTLASVWGLVDNFDVQKIITTQSETLLAAAPLLSLRRLSRYRGIVRQWRVHDGALKPDELRKLTYHLRARRGEATFARLWILVEGETEFWMLRELGRVAGYDFDLEGIACVEFAQCGIPPLVKAARELGIEWHLLTDGDAAGLSYVEKARALLRGDPPEERITALREHDIEHCFYQHGYAAAYQRAAGMRVSPRSKVPPKAVIHRALQRWSKPYMALQVILAASEPGSPGVPPPLRGMMDTCVRLARDAPRRGSLESGPSRKPRKKSSR